MKVILVLSCSLFLFACDKPVAQAENPTGEQPVAPEQTQTFGVSLQQITLENSKGELLSGEITDINNLNLQFQADQ